MDSRNLREMYFKTREIYTKNKIKKRSRKKVTKELKNKKLTIEQEHKAKEFYKPYRNIITNFHEFYYQKTGKFYENYLPDDLYYCDIDMYFNNWSIGQIIDNKSYYSRMFPKVKQPDMFACRVNGFWYNHKNELVKKKEIIDSLKNEEELFIKYALESAGGKGVYYINNENKDIEEQFENIINETDRDIVIQRALKQHKVLALLNPSSVNTIRVLSLLKEDGVKIYSCVLRMGINGSKVDNASSGGITCGIKEDGYLKDVAYTAKGEKFKKTHPTTGVEFSTIQIPKFKEICNMVKQTAPLLPHCRLVSWDISVDEEENIVLIEANLKYGELDFHQLNNGPLFGDDTKAILDEVYSKK